MVSRELRHALHNVNAPSAVLDRAAFDANIAGLRARAGGLPIRVASKSLRTPAAIEAALAAPGFGGVLAYSLPEALHLHAGGIRDIVIAYPSVDRAALQTMFAEVARADRVPTVESLPADDQAPDDSPTDRPLATANITFMIDSTAHLDLIDSVREAAMAEAGAGDRSRPVRICLDIDASYRPGEDPLGKRIGLSDRVHIGARRSPIRDTLSAVALAREVLARPGFELVGLMSYEGQIAGTANAGRSPGQMALRMLQKRSARELTRRRTAIVAAIRELTDLEFVNGGGTGSLESSSAEGSLTELAAGSGLFAPGLFDGYTHFRHEPAAYFVTPVVRRPAPDWVTVFKGGYIASGIAGPDRVPTIAWPPDLEYAGLEGAGEVQTPLAGAGSELLQIGDLVYFRHAKAGELAEHFNEFLVVSDGEIVDEWTTYRGHGWVV